jgi:hypothetical protein
MNPPIVYEKPNQVARGPRWFRAFFSSSTREGATIGIISPAIRRRCGGSLSHRINSERDSADRIFDLVDDLLDLLALSFRQPGRSSPPARTPAASFTRPFSSVHRTCRSPWSILLNFPAALESNDCCPDLRSSCVTCLRRSFDANLLSRKVCPGHRIGRGRAARPIAQGKSFRG